LDKIGRGWKRYQWNAYLRYHPGFCLVKLKNTLGNLSGWSAVEFEPTYLTIADLKSATLPPKPQRLGD